MAETEVNATRNLRADQVDIWREAYRLGAEAGAAAARERADAADRLLAEAWDRGEWAGRQNAAEAHRVAHWSHIGSSTPNLRTNPYTTPTRRETETDPTPEES